MKLPEEFSFMNGGKEFPTYKRGGGISKETIYGYNSSNFQRSNILLFGEIFNKKTIYKYIDRRKFKEYVRKQDQGFSLCFQEPSSWQDPYESRFYKADYSKMFSNVDFVKDKKMSLYACCFAMQKDSEPSWKMYVDESNQTDRKVCIQLKINFKALLDYLNYYITNKVDNQYILVAGPVKYMEKNEINNLHRPDDNGELASIFKDFNFSKYLRLLKVKRNAYKYEDEMRLFLIPKDGKVEKKNLIIPIPAECPTDVIKSRRWGRIVEMLYLDPNSTDKELNDYIEHFEKTKFGLEKGRFDISDIYDSFSNIIIGEEKEAERKRKEQEINEELERQKKKLEKRLKASL